MTIPQIQGGTIQQFNSDVNILSAALWQHSQAPNILGLLNAKQAFYDTNQTDFWQDFETNIFNLATANSFGLVIWSIILGAPIKYILTAGGQPSWGFGTNHVNFTNGNFSSISGSNSTYALSEETARVILQLQYFKLIGTCTVPAINRALNYIFSKNYGSVYINDSLNMTQEYVFDFVPPSDMQFAFNSFDVLPRPSGVQSGWTVFIEAPWGFNSDASNFNHSNFTDQ